MSSPSTQGALSAQVVAEHGTLFSFRQTRLSSGLLEQAMKDLDEHQLTGVTEQSFRELLKEPHDTAHLLDTIE